jgi:hypothetical protein
VTSEALSRQRNIGGVFTCSCGKKHIILVEGDDIVIVEAPGTNPEPPPIGRDL